VARRAGSQSRCFCRGVFFRFGFLAVSLGAARSISPPGLSPVLPRLRRDTPRGPAQERGGLRRRLLRPPRRRPQQHLSTFWSFHQEIQGLSCTRGAFRKFHRQGILWWGGGNRAVLALLPLRGGKPAGAPRAPPPVPTPPPGSSAFPPTPYPGTPPPASATP